MSAPRRPVEAAPPGRIITFYSYKGGTGRSMAVANVAWILASQGKRVLAIDWDIEAPGLHRYFCPFLEDPELSRTPGLIDFFVDVSTAARSAAAQARQEWWREHASLLRYTTSLDWEFGGNGTLDLVSAGRQDVSYPIRVTTFDWNSFYRDLGGGVFLEALKEQLRSQYDYVLIDSRTGISDTAGICTVQMPDALVVCFTLNRQSIRGAAGIAASAHGQRLRPNDTPGLTIWPVPMRIELGEKQRLDAARDSYRTEFLQFIAHVPRDRRDAYWSDVEVLYQPFFAYEEVLAVFAERRSRKGSLLSSTEALTAYLTDGAISRLAPMDENVRVATLARFSGTAGTGDEGSEIFISGPTTDRGLVRKLQKALDAHGIPYWSTDMIGPGEEVRRVTEAALDRSAAVIAVVGRKVSEVQGWELAHALAAKKLVLPVYLTHAPRPPALADLGGIQTKGHLLSKTDLTRLIDALPVARHPLNPDDPQKGRWGGAAERNARRLSADVRAIGDGWYGISLSVTAIGTRRPLTGSVEFHLHPTFSPRVRTVPVKDGVATLSLEAYGAFTVGAKADAGATRLELDLSLLPTAPQAFRER